jgi:hypothetical protein
MRMRTTLTAAALVAAGTLVFGAAGSFASNPVKARATRTRDRAIWLCMRMGDASSWFRVRAGPPG